MREIKWTKLYKEYLDWAFYELTTRGFDFPTQKLNNEEAHSMVFGYWFCNVKK